MNTKPTATAATGIKPSIPTRTVTASTASYFDGTTIGLLGRRLLAFFLTLITLGIAFPWLKCMLIRWRVEHTVINGQRLKFTGTGGSLFFKWLLWSILTLITLGAYSIFVDVSFEKWKTDNTTSRSENLSKPQLKSSKLAFILVPVIIILELAVLIVLYNFALKYFEWIPEIPFINLATYGLFF